MDILLLYWLPCLCMVAGTVLSARRLMHYFQLESYQFRGYFQTVKRQWKQALTPYWTLTGIYLCIFLLYTFTGTVLWTSAKKDSWSFLLVLWVFVCCAGYVLAGWLVRMQGLKHKEKKKFVLTARVKRLYGILIMVLVLIPVIVFLMNGNNPAKGAIYCMAAVMTIDKTDR